MLRRAPVDSQVYREPFFSLRRPSRSVVSRFLAHLLVRLLIVSALPGQWQAVAALFPVSMLWPLVAPEERASAPGDAGPETRVRGLEQENASCVRREALQAAGTHQGYGLGYDGSAVDPTVWGNFRFRSELNADGDTVAAKNRFAFIGYLWDKETNLFFAKARFYDPQVGRFTTQDSFLGQVDDPPSLHRYFYANDNPTRYVDPTEHAVQVTDARGTVTKASLDGLDREIARLVDVGGLNLLTTTEHDGAGNKTRAVDARGNATVWRYDALGRLTSMEDAKLQPATFTYDGEGLKLTETDRRGVTRTHTYDNLGRPRLSRIAEGSPLSGVGWSHEIQYQDAARKRVEIDARGYATIFDLDGLGRVVKETDVRNKDVQTSWDGVNRREVRDKRGHTTRYEYDRINRLVKTTDPVPFESQMPVTTYGDAANLVSETDRRGTVKITQLDPLGRVRTITRDGIVLERNTYDGLGNKVLAEDGESKKTSFVYDKANRLSQRIDGFESAEAATTVYAYDRNGNLADERDQRATDLGEPFPSTKKAYDELNRLLTVTDGEANVTTYGYDAEGNRTSVREPEGQETAYAYDELGKLTRVVQPGTTATRYRYDRNRNKLEQEDARGKIVAYQYDQLNRLTTLTQLGGLTTEHQYDENGNETLLTDPKGQTVTSTYDELNRLETKTYASATGDSYRPWRYTTGVTYTYDPNGNLTTAVESLAGTGPTTLTTSRATTGSTASPRRPRSYPTRRQPPGP